MFDSYHDHHLGGSIVFTLFLLLLTIIICIPVLLFYKISGDGHSSRSQLRDFRLRTITSCCPCSEKLFNCISSIVKMCGICCCCCGCKWCAKMDKVIEYQHRERDRDRDLYHRTNSKSSVPSTSINIPNRTVTASTTTGTDTRTTRRTRHVAETDKCNSNKDNKTNDKRNNNILENKDKTKNENENEKGDKSKNKKSVERKNITLWKKITTRRKPLVVSSRSKTRIISSDVEKGEFETVVNSISRSTSFNSINDVETLMGINQIRKRLEKEKEKDRDNDREKHKHRSGHIDKNKDKEKNRKKTKIRKKNGMKRQSDNQKKLANYANEECRYHPAENTDTGSTIGMTDPSRMCKTREISSRDERQTDSSVNGTSTFSSTSRTMRSGITNSMTSTSGSINTSMSTSTSTSIRTMPDWSRSSNTNSGSKSDPESSYRSRSSSRDSRSSRSSRSSGRSKRNNNNNKNRHRSRGRSKSQGSASRLSPISEGNKQREVEKNKKRKSKNDYFAFFLSHKVVICNMCVMIFVSGESIRNTIAIGNNDSINPSETISRVGLYTLTYICFVLSRIYAFVFMRFRYNRLSSVQANKNDIENENKNYNGCKKNDNDNDNGESVNKKTKNQVINSGKNGKRDWNSKSIRLYYYLARILIFVLVIHMGVIILFAALEEDNLNHFANESTKGAFHIVMHNVLDNVVCIIYLLFLLYDTWLNRASREEFENAIIVMIDFNGESIYNHWDNISELNSKISQLKECRTDLQKQYNLNLNAHEKFHAKETRAKLRIKHNRKQDPDSYQQRWVNKRSKSTSTSHHKPNIELQISISNEDAAAAEAEMVGRRDKMHKKRQKRKKKMLKIETQQSRTQNELDRGHQLRNYKTEDFIIHVRQRDALFDVLIQEHILYKIELYTMIILWLSFLTFYISTLFQRWIGLYIVGGALGIKCFFDILCAMFHNSFFIRYYMYACAGKHISRFERMKQKFNHKRDSDKNGNRNGNNGRKGLSMNHNVRSTSETDSHSASHSNPSQTQSRSGSRRGSKSGSGSRSPSSGSRNCGHHRVVDITVNGMNSSSGTATTSSSYNDSVTDSNSNNNNNNNKNGNQKKATESGLNDKNNNG